MVEETIREQLIDAIAARLSGFSWTTLTDPEVFTGKAIIDPETDNLPAFTVLAGTEETEQKRYGVDSNTMPVSIACIISLEDGADVDAVCEPVLGEMKVALFKDGHIELGTEDSGEEIEAFSFFKTGGGIQDYPDELGPAIVNITISAVVEYDEAAGDPYN